MSYNSPMTLSAFQFTSCVVQNAKETLSNEKPKRSHIHLTKQTSAFFRRIYIMLQSFESLLQTDRDWLLHPIL